MHPTFNDLFPKLQLAARRWVPDVITEAGPAAGYDLDPENEQAVRYALAWACAHPKFDGDPGKGLLLLGHKGTGKTLLMRSLAGCLEGQPLHFGWINTRKITSAYNVEGDAGLQPYLSPRHMLFDDLGDERMGQHYGDKVEVMSLLIQERYELFIDKGTMSHFTTNLDPSEIKARYGDRVYSRLKHMVNSIRVGAETDAMDRRETAHAKEREIAKPQAFEPASPEVAAEGFRLVREAILRAKEEMEVKEPKMHAVPRGETSQAIDLAAYAVKCKRASEGELTNAAEALALNNTPEAAGPFIKVIEAELESRKAQVA